MDSPAIAVHHLFAGYGAGAVVRDVTLDVHAGEVVALLGPNGAGKTTVLRAISGLIAASAGSIELFGEDVTGQRAHHIARRGLAHVPEGRALFADLSVTDNLRLGSRSRQSRRDGVERALELIPELAPLRKRPAGALSGGEQQMLALARALAGSPRCLIVDEMSLGLAPIIVRRLAPIVRRIASDSGVAVLMVEQHVPIALGVADRVFALARGRVVLHRPAAELVEQPDLLRASYLGLG